MGLRDHLKNVIGFTTKRRIVVIESDDWGSIRTRDKIAYDNMLKAGLNVNENPYTMYDALESNSDLIRLFDVLTKFKDSNGSHPIITPMYIMGNPNFDAIKSNGFEKYEFEHFLDTCKKYPHRENIEKIIGEGIKANIFMPELHGREHINAPRWMRLLRSGNEVVKISFDNESFGAMAFNGIRTPSYLNTFDPELPEDIEYIKENLADAVSMFNNTFGYSPKHFIEPDDFGPQEIEKILNDLGIKYLLRAKLTKYSNYHNSHTGRKLRWVGKRNEFNQIYLTRNCTFEPHRPLNLTDVVASCIKDIENAFLWNKPAVIITHRSSYVGSISQKNQENGLSQLEQLLGTIIKKWPNVEFKSSTELGDIISRKIN